MIFFKISSSSISDDPSSALQIIEIIDIKSELAKIQQQMPVVPVVNVATMLDQMVNLGSNLLGSDIGNATANATVIPTIINPIVQVPPPHHTWESLFGGLALTVPYDSYSIKVYKHPDNKYPTIKVADKIYFFEPMFQLMPASATSYVSSITSKPEMSFSVKMWEDNLRATVRRQMPNVNPENIHILPVQKLKISSTMVLAKNVQLSSDLIDYKNESQLVNFKFTCDVASDCNDLANLMKSSPEKFALTVHLLLIDPKVPIKMMKFSVENIMDGQLMSKLDLMFKGKQVLLSEGDKMKLLSESVDRAVIQMLDKTNLATVRVQMADSLKNLLQIKTIESLKAWDSMHWEEDVKYRPDKAAEILNNLYKKLDTDTMAKMISMWSANDQSNLVALITNTLAQMSSDLDAKKLLTLSQNNIKWLNESFVPILNRMSLARLAGRISLRNLSTAKVSAATFFLMAGVRVDLSSIKITSSSPEVLTKTTSESTLQTTVNPPSKNYRR